MKLEDRMKSLGAGLAVAAATIALFSTNTTTTFWRDHPLIRYILGIALCLLFVFLLFTDWFLKVYRGRVMRKRNLSDIVVSKKISIIDIHDEGGHRASYFQKAHFSNIKNGDYIVHLKADANHPDARISAEHLQLANCSVNFDSVHKSMDLYFSDHIQGLNKVKSLYSVEKFAYFSAELVDCFTDQEKDTWDITTFNYTKEYQLEIHFPRGRRVDQVAIYRRGEEKDIKVEAAQPVIIDKGDKDSIFLLITGFDQLDKFVIKWSYKK